MTTQTKSTNIYKQKLYTFLLERKIRHTHSAISTYTHVSMDPDFRGKFSIGKNDLDKFWTLYQDALKYGAVLYIAERPSTVRALYIDVDIEMKEDTYNELPIHQTNNGYITDNVELQAIYHSNHIRNLIKICQTSIRKLVKDVTPNHLICYVLTRSPYKKFKNGVNTIKSGFHLHFPYIFLTQRDLKSNLFPHIKHNVKQSNIFCDINVRDSSSLLDEGVIKHNTCWLLYGSTKDSKLEPYEISLVFDHNLNNIELKKSLEGFFHYNTKGDSIYFRGNESFHMPSILSINGRFGREALTLRSQSSILLEHTDMKRSISGRNNSRQAVNPDDFKTLKYFLPLLSPKRSEDYHDWNTVGYIIHKYTNGSEDGFKLFDTFSKECKEKYNYNQLVVKWDEYASYNYNYTLSTVVYFAKIDSPARYKKIIENSFNIDNICQNGGTHGSIANLTYQLFKNQYVCSNISKRIWFRYEDHRWQIMDDAWKLRLKICSEVKQIFKKRKNVLRKKLRELRNAEDDSKYGDDSENSSGMILDRKDINVTDCKSEMRAVEKKLNSIQKIIISLETCPFLKNVINMAADKFHEKHQKFYENLDQNPNIIGVKNGVLEILEDDIIFRNGHPEDRISKQMGVKYNSEYSHKHKKIIQIKEILRKLHPNSDIRKFFLNIISTILKGGNIYKIITFWTGVGDNGKSIMVSWLEKMLGEYAVKFPTSLITGKRTQSSAASPEVARAGGGIRWATIQEPNKTKELNIGLIKEFTGNDKIPCRQLFMPPRDIIPLFDTTIICNDIPKASNGDRAYWNRVRIIPFQSTFVDIQNLPKTEAEQEQKKIFLKDPSLANKLGDLAEGLLWLLVDIYRQRLKNNETIYVPQAVKLATKQYQRRNNIWHAFITDEIDIKDLKNAQTKNSISVSQLWIKFKTWYADAYSTQTKLSKLEFTEEISKRCGEPTEQNIWRGIKFKGM